VRFPNVMGCTHDIVKIREMVESSKRKGLLNAQSPELIIQDTGGNEFGELDELWQIG